MKFEDMLKQISQIKSDFVIVGGAAEVFHGKKATTKDIDLVVKDLSPFRYLGKTECWQTKSLFSKTGKRGFIRRADYSMDIFIEKSLPKYVVDKATGLKYETLESMIDFYKRLYYAYDPVKQWKQRLFVKTKHDRLAEFPLDPTAVFPPK